MGRFNFSKADRILKRREYLKIAGNGRRMGNYLFSMTVLPAKRDRSRLGLIVTKKFGKAAARNRMKRICREFFRLNRHELTKTWDITIFVKRDARGLPTQRLNHALRTLLYRIEKQ